MKTKREDPLPKKVILCESHFSAEMFDKSVDLQRRFMKERGMKLKQRKLITTAVPDIFPFSSSKQAVKRPNIMTKIRERQKKNRSAQSQTDHVQPPIQTSDVGTQTREENVTSEELNTIFNTTALETMADLLGLPSLPSIVRKFYRTHEKDDQNADQNEEKFGSFHQ
uniref:Uncharacterized protein n=1 Tax=Clytia hemisphaerica TaxID=252671 RepID=A0A7M5X900_9CNID